MPFFNCISKINNMHIYDARDIDAVMPMHNLIEYCDNYSKTFGVLWQYCRDKPALNNANDDIGNFSANNAATNQFKIKYKITSKTGNNCTKDTGIVVPLKYGSNFQRNFEIPLINREINLDPSKLVWKLCYSGYQ